MTNDVRESDVFDPAEIEFALAQHPMVREAVVQKDEEGKRLVAYFVREDDSAEADYDGGTAEATHLAHWQVRYDEFYSQTAAADPRFDIRGWNSSYTGQPIPDQEMQEWLEDTIATIVALRPRKVLEIGCGSGLVLFRVAPYCNEYVATDFSAVMLERLGGELLRTGRELSHVSLIHQSATNFEGLASRDFDVVILNSVVQYFPSVEYLMSVLGGAVERTRPGGVVFVGDVRSHVLIETLHLSLEFHRAAPALQIEEFRERVAAAMHREDELLVHPGFFRCLPEVLPRIGHVEVLPKRGHHHNELNRFRYQALLYIEPVLAVVGDLAWRDWHGSSCNLAWVEGELRSPQLRPLALANIPNARLTQERALRAFLAEDCVKTLGDMRLRISSVTPDGIDPEDIIAFGERLGYEVRLSWLEHDCGGAFDAVFLPPKTGVPSYRSASAKRRLFKELANSPARTPSSYSLPARNDSHPGD